MYGNTLASHISVTININAEFGSIQRIEKMKIQGRSFKFNATSRKMLSKKNAILLWEYFQLQQFPFAFQYIILF